MQSYAKKYAAGEEQTLYVKHFCPNLGDYSSTYISFPGETRGQESYNALEKFTSLTGT